MIHLKIIDKSLTNSKPYFVKFTIYKSLLNIFFFLNFQLKAINHQCSVPLKKLLKRNHLNFEKKKKKKRRKKNVINFTGQISLPFCVEDWIFNCFSLLCFFRVGWL